MASLLQTSHAYATPRYISPPRPITSSFSRQRLLTRNLSFRNRPPCSFPIFGWKIKLFASCRGNLSVRSVYSDRERNKKEESERPRFDINLAVVLAGFSFEAYTTPPRNIGRHEVDGAGCKTVYLSESFVREIYDGQLFIKLKKGIDLPAMDPWGTSDPYVVMQLDGQVAKSKIKWGKKEPTWNQKFKFNIKRLPNKNLQVAVWDANLVTPHKRMGNAIVNLEAFYNGDLHDVWVELEGMGGGGKLQMEVRYKTFEEIDNEKRWWKLPFVSKYLQKDRIRSAFNNVVGSEGVQARQFVEFAFGRLKSFNGLYLSKDQVLRRNGSQVVDYSEKTPVSDTVLENGDTPELSVQEANSSEDSKVELSPSDNESLDSRPVELETPNSEATLSYKHFWKSLADSMNEKVKHKLGLPASMDLKWEAYELLTSIGLQLQKIAEAGYVESGLATPEGRDRDADNNRRPLSIGAIQSSLPDIKKATEELVTQTDSVLRALMVLTETISKLNKEARDLEKSSSESEKLSPLNSAALDEKKAEEMRALFSTAESAMEAWAMLSASLGHPSFVKSEFEKLCFLDHASTDTQVVVWRDSARRRLVVSFRGTDQSSWKDFRTDFMIAPVGLNPERIGGDFQQEVQVHSGFLKAYDSVRTKLVSVIKRSIDYRGDESEPPNKWRVYLTGHSLGGALATLLALELSSSQLVKKGAISIAMYNFGSPRVGNKRFAEVYNERVKDSWRVVNHRDIIPTVPHLMGYCHVAQPLYLVAGGLEDALENLDILKDGYEVDVVGEYTPDVLVNEFMKGEKELIEKILQTEINIFRSIRDGTALMQHMEDFYYISLLEHVRANYQIPTLVERTKQI